MADLTAGTTERLFISFLFFSFSFSSFFFFGERLERALLPEERLTKKS